MISTEADRVQTKSAPGPSLQVQKLQAKLARLGYYTGFVNGYVNEGTVRAMDRLRRDAGLPSTGRLDLVA